MQLPKNEAKRLIALRQYQLKEAKVSNEYQMLVELAANHCGCQQACISIVGSDTSWTLACNQAPPSPVERSQSLAAWAILQPQSLVISDIGQHPEASQLTIENGINFYAAVHLETDDGLTLGVLSVSDSQPKQLSTEQIDFLKNLGQIIIRLLSVKQSETMIKNQQSNIELYQNTIKGLNKELVRLSITDDLTQLHNMRSLRQKLNSEMQRSRRYNTPLSLLILDLDNFKQFNEAYGHHEGDVILQIIARVLCNNTRETDIISRFGGEEFVIVMPYTDVETAQMLAERLRNAVAQQESIDHKVTVSIGVCQFAERHENDTDIINDAEEAMQQAKQEGRNCVSLASSVPQE